MLCGLHRKSVLHTQPELTVQAVVLLVRAFAQDGWGAVVEDGGGFDGSQAAHGNGGSSWRIWFGWARVGLWNMFG